VTNKLRRMLFNLWYFRHPPWDSGISPPELMEFIDTHPSGRALDLGCGTGTNVLTLIEHGWQVTGVDFASRAISIAQRKIQAAGLSAELRVADVTRLDGITGPFDFVLDLGCFHGLQKKEKDLYLDQLIRVNAANGFWLLYGFFKASTAQSGPGLVPNDIERILTRFRLVSRKDGVDRRDRPSAYLLFSKK
jgi:cyclopropane fatty-acyl-phospholipid synthase-like methyltransferase